MARYPSAILQHGTPSGAGRTCISGRNTFHDGRLTRCLAIDVFRRSPVHPNNAHCKRSSPAPARLSLPACRGLPYQLVPGTVLIAAQAETALPCEFSSNESPQHLKQCVDSRAVHEHLQCPCVVGQGTAVDVCTQMSASRTRARDGFDSQVRQRLDGLGGCPAERLEDAEIVRRGMKGAAPPVPKASAARGRVGKGKGARAAAAQAAAQEAAAQEDAQEAEWWGAPRRHPPCSPAP